jgi:glycosyltransferase involved in cell wall biosynthesis
VTSWFERLLYRRAARIVALTRGIESGIVKTGVRPEKVLFVPNGVDDILGADSQPTPGSGNGVFRVVYVGALGRWNGNETLVDAATLLKDDAGIEFVMVGDGDQRVALEQRARAGGRAHALPGGPPQGAGRGRDPRSGRLRHLHLDHPFHSMVLANKIFDYLGAGKPVLAAARGEMEQLLAEARAGRSVPPGDPSALAALVREMRDLPVTERQAMGRRGREHVLAHYRRSDLARKTETEMVRLAL